MRSMNVAGILACAVMILGVTICVSPLTLPSIAPVRASTRAISLVANYPNWNTTNPTITVTKGDTITINLSSGDGSTHQLLIDFDGEYMGGPDCTTAADQCSSNFSPSTPTQMPPFTITSNAGIQVLLYNTLSLHAGTFGSRKSLITNFHDQLEPNFSNRCTRLIRDNFHHTN